MHLRAESDGLGLVLEKTYSACAEQRLLDIGN
jgi:hypothetical protein